MKDDSGHIIVAAAMVGVVLIMVCIATILLFVINDNTPSAVPNIVIPQNDYEFTDGGVGGGIKPLQNLTITFIDVGQGDAIFIQSPFYMTMVVDTGTDKSCDHVLDIVGRNQRIDYLVLTHPHADHTGCLDELKNDLVVKSVNTNTDTDSDYAILLDPKTQVRVLNPPTRERFSDENDNSVVLLITYRNSTILLTGDSEYASEDYYRDKLPHIDVLKVAHHGSDSSTSAKLLAKTTPDYCIISVGEGNRYGHPGQTTLDWLGYYGCEIHRTDREGDITMTTDGETWITL